MTTIYKSVLLVDGMMVNWKIGTVFWDTVDKALEYRQPIKVPLDNPGNITVKYEAIQTKSKKETNDAFLNSTFFKQFRIHPDVEDIIILPY